MRPVDARTMEATWKEMACASPREARKWIKEMELLAGKGPKRLIQAAEEMFGRSRQPELLRYVVEALMEEGEPGCVIRPDARGLMLIRLMTVIEALDASTRDAEK